MMPYQYNTTLQNQNMYEQNLKNIINQANSQLQQLQNQPTPIIPQQPITQNFQLAPNPSNTDLEAKYANSIEEVRNTFVMKTGIFTDKDFSTIWIKDVTGNIRTFKTEEVIEMDEKDKEIYALKKQIEDMRGMILNANESNVANDDEQITNTKSKRVQSNKRVDAK